MRFNKKTMVVLMSLLFSIMLMSVVNAAICGSGYRDLVVNSASRDTSIFCEPLQRPSLDIETQGTVVFSTSLNEVYDCVSSDCTLVASRSNDGSPYGTVNDGPTYSVNAELTQAARDSTSPVRPRQGGNGEAEAGAQASGLPPVSGELTSSGALRFDVEDGEGEVIKVDTVSSDLGDLYVASHPTSEVASTGYEIIPSTTVPGEMVHHYTNLQLTLDRKKVEGDQDDTYTTTANAVITPNQYHNGEATFTMSYKDENGEQQVITGTIDDGILSFGVEKGPGSDDLSPELRAALQRLYDASIKSEEEREEDIEAHYGGTRPGILQNQKSYFTKMAGNFVGRFKAIFNAHLEQLLGPYFYAIPEYLCGDSLYADTTKQQGPGQEGKIFTGTMLDPPESPTYKSVMQKEIMDNLGTLQIAGEKTELTKNLYRYAVSVKMIGDSNYNGEWKLYLKNSCTSESSYEDFVDSDGSLGWYEYGSLGDQQYFGNHYAGANLLMDCTTGESCRFDMVCISFGSPYCVTLAHGGGFKTSGSTGSTAC